MTCREKWELDHPGEKFDIRYDCTYTLYGVTSETYCNPNATMESCHKCWEQEYPERSNMNEPKEEPKLIYAHTSTDTISEESDTATAKPVIKDSGNRREFESGAVRDMQEGKGRCDLMPLEVVGEYLTAVRGANKNILQAISEFKKTGCTNPLYSAIGYFTSVAYNEDDFTMLLELAKHFEEGAKKYGENNWQKGIPPKCYIDSAVRHYIKWLRGDNDEPHDRAFCWNLMCCIWEVDYHSKATEAENA